MNKYLEKVAQFMSEENKQVGKTFAYQSAASLPAHVVGAVTGGLVGKRFLKAPASSINRGIGRLAGRVGSTGSIGRFASKGIRSLKGTTGGALGAAAGVALAGGVADLAALKHSLHGKVKE